ncbi:MAG TPA: RDD family protein [Spirochaetota bacterium]
MFSDHFGNPLEFEAAPLTYRGLAYIIDRIILVIFWIILIYLIIQFSHTHAGEQLSKSFGAASNPAKSSSPGFEILTTIFVVIFIFTMYVLIFLPIALCEFFLKGKSPGKLLFGLRIESTNGESPSFSQVLLRSLIRDIESTIGLIFIMATPQRQTFYDTLVGTVVIRYRYEKRPVIKKAETNKKETIAFVLPLTLQHDALLWQRYYKTMNRSEHGGEGAFQYMTGQARKELLRRIPAMGKYIPDGRGKDALAKQSALLQLFSSALDRNEVKWENR